MKPVLIHPQVVEAILLRNSSRLTDILLKELASKKDMVGLNVWRVNVKAAAGLGYSV